MVLTEVELLGDKLLLVLPQRGSLLILDNHHRQGVAEERRVREDVDRDEVHDESMTGGCMYL